MKLYINTKKMIFEEDNIEHEIVLNVSDNEFYGYDILMELPDDDKFIKDTFKIEYKKDKDGKDTDEIENKMFRIREIETWWSFPNYEIINGEIVLFEWRNYSYFLGTERRMALAEKINILYNVPSELKILRETLAYIMNELHLIFPPDYDIMNAKINEVIAKNPKEEIE